ARSPTSSVIAPIRALRPASSSAKRRGTFRPTRRWRLNVGSEISVPQLEADPYPIYAQLREEQPVCFVESVGLWLVTRWDDVQHVDRTPDLFTGATEPSTLERTFGKNLLASEGTYHDRIRSIVYPWFRVGAIGDYPDQVIAPLAHELIDPAAPRRHGDLVSHVAQPLSARVT